MYISDRLIQQFFSGSCTEEEKRMVAAFFKENPDKLAEYLTEERWDAFDPGTRSEMPGPDLRRSIEERVGPASVRSLPIRRMAAAAVILLMAGYGLVRIESRNRGPKTPESAIAHTPATNTSKAVLQDTICNITGRTRSYALPDGSKARLSTGSTLTFCKAFTADRRDLFLKGEGVFTVANDQSRPFTVYGGGVATTALGTVFSVNATRKPVTTVRLYSGKIVIKKDGPGPSDSFKDIYLSPGQAAMIKKDDFSSMVWTPAARKIEVRPVNDLPQSVFTFSKQPLTEILPLLQKRCKATITYDPANLKNIDFTGTFDKDKETLESFLTTLCDLNELALVKNGDSTFSIQAK